MPEPTANIVPQVILYTRAGCHLCEEAKAELRALQKQAAFTLREIDVDSDPELLSLYSDEVPVIFIQGRKAFKFRIERDEFLKRLHGL